MFEEQVDVPNGTILELGEDSDSTLCSGNPPLAAKPCTIVVPGVRRTDENRQRRKDEPGAKIIDESTNQWGEYENNL